MKTIISFLALICCTVGAMCQKYTISGYVKDKSSGEELIGANVFVDELQTGATTNAYGFYSLSLPAGTYHLHYSFIGYAELSTTVVLDKNIGGNVLLESSAIITDEVIVSGEKRQNIDDSRMSVVKLPVETVKSLPAFMGEVDIMKTIQLLPGIQAAGEGNTGFYVRGGGPDQNLILLDEAVVYNAAHLLGFFSVFNADAIKDMEIYKGGMPAQYGGRISSVLDITMKNGNMKKFQCDGSIGSVSTKFTVQGPIVKDKCSFIVSGRRTYLDALLKLLLNKDSPLRVPNYHFFDLNAKVNYRFSDKNRLFLSTYYGKDVFSLDSRKMGLAVDIPWGNATGSLRWNHLFSNKFFSNTTAVISDYKFQTDIEMKNQNNENAKGIEFIQNSGIRDYALKQDFTILPNPRHNIKCGLSYTYHVFTPNSVSAAFGVMDFDFGNSNKQFAHEGAVYVGDDWKISRRITVYAGLRGALFAQVGPFTRFVKNATRTLTIDTISYAAHEKVCLYTSLEPRASLKFSIGDNSSIKASFMQNKQFIHLVSLSTTTLPTDLWISCSDKVKPQKGRQYALGYFMNFDDNLYEASVEVYYKKLWNLVEYADGALPGEDVNDNADNYFIFGDGYSYGVELFVKKRAGSFTGWLGYTWSRTNRSFPDVDNGEVFPAKYDRRHDLSLTGTYRFNDKWSLSTVFVFATGNATTMPISRYMIDGHLVTEYGKRNSFRMPAYHRLDLSVDYQFVNTKKWQASLNISIYNVYSRQNPYFIYVYSEGSVTDGSFKTIAKQVSLFPILPSFTWNFKF